VGVLELILVVYGFLGVLFGSVLLGVVLRAVVEFCREVGREE
jgi:hypothetical protein